MRTRTPGGVGAGGLVTPWLPDLNEARGAQPTDLSTYSLQASAFFRGIDGRTGAVVPCHFPDFSTVWRHASLARRHVAACKPRRRSWLW